MTTTKQLTMESHSESDVWELFTERAAIREHDGGNSREHAEDNALRDVRRILGTLPKWLIERVEAARRHD